MSAGIGPFAAARKILSFAVLFSLIFAFPRTGLSQVVHGSMEVRWNEGAPDCSRSAQPSLQVHDYNATTFIVRENLCQTFEAPFIYLLVGSNKTLLIDSGDVADASLVPLARTVNDLLPTQGAGKLPLVVAHTHRHLDHRAGDAQFAQLSKVALVGPDLASVRRFFGFKDWPNAVSQIDLGGRIVDVLPTPGHSDTEISFYDRQTGLFFSGDFLLPGRLLIGDAAADLASAERAAAFVRSRPVTFVLGGHIEMDAAGHTFPWQSHYHPKEHVLELTKADLLALPAALRRFDGLYTQSNGFVMMDSLRVRELSLAILAVIIAGCVGLLVRYIRHRKRQRRAKGQGLPAGPAQIRDAARSSTGTSSSAAV